MKSSEWSGWAFLHNLRAEALAHGLVIRFPVSNSDSVRSDSL
jgi:hypothetical protein